MRGVVCLHGLSTPTFNGHWAHGGQSPCGTCQEVPLFSGCEYKSPGVDIQNQTHYASLVTDVLWRNRHDFGRSICPAAGDLAATHRDGAPFFEQFHIHGTSVSRKFNFASPPPLGVSWISSATVPKLGQCRSPVGELGSVGEGQQDGATQEAQVPGARGRALPSGPLRMSPLRPLRRPLAPLCSPCRQGPCRGHIHK